MNFGRQIGRAGEIGGGHMNEAESMKREVYSWPCVSSFYYDQIFLT